MSNSTSTLLAPFASSLTFLTTTPVHSTLFPYPLASTLHAARISLIFQSKVQAQGKDTVGWKTYLAGFLIMSWGGMLWSNLLLGLHPPVLWNWGIWVNYLGVHLALTALVNVVPSVQTISTTSDHILFPLDAVLRVNAVTSTIATLTSHPSLVSSPLSSSVLTTIIIGAIASSGGGVTAATLNLWSPNWTLSTPVFLRKGTGLLGTVDLWGGSIVALMFSQLTGHISLPYSSDFTSDTMKWTPLDAKALCIVVLSVLFGLRAFQGLPAPPPPPKGKGEKKKNQ